MRTTKQILFSYKMAVHIYISLWSTVIRTIYQQLMWTDCRKSEVLFSYFSTFHVALQFGDLLH